MQEATTLKRVKPEPSDGTPANKRLKPDELERVVTPEGDSQQVEIDHVVDPETRAREAIRAAEAAGDISPLRQKGDTDTKTPEARFDLAMGLFAVGQHELAIDEFLELIHMNRSWNEEAGRVQLLKVFDTLGPTHELTVAGRKRLSSILFS